MNILMHMSDGLISVNIGIVFSIISFVMIGYTIKKLNKENDDQKIPIMAVMGAFVFVAQMINFTIPATGSSGHIGGGILLCLMLGQYPAFLSLSTVLIIQCLFFGDGGILALGCNIFNIGILPCFIAYPYIVKPILKKVTNKRIIIASILGVVTGLQLGSLAVVLETSASNISALPFTSFVVLMQPIHLIIGIIEGIITATIVLFVYKEKSQLLDVTINKKSFKTINLNSMIKKLIVLIILIGGGLSLYSSNNPDGLEWSIKAISGNDEIVVTDKTKKALGQIQETTTILPDYNFKESQSKLGISTAGILGGSITLLFIGGIGYFVVKRKKHG